MAVSIGGISELALVATMFPDQSRALNTVRNRQVFPWEQTFSFLFVFRVRFPRPQCIPVHFLRAFLISDFRIFEIPGLYFTKAQYRHYLC